VRAGLVLAGRPSNESPKPDFAVDQVAFLKSTEHDCEVLRSRRSFAGALPDFCMAPVGVVEFHR
jgi:hypothetical protein